MSKLIILFTCFFSTFYVVANKHFVSPTGTAAGTGSISAPFDLQTALNHPLSIQANDTIYLLSGIYQGNFTSNLNGQVNQYIYVLQFPGQRATIEDNRQYASGATLQINGSWTIYKDFEIRNSFSSRSSSGPASFRPMGIQMQAPNSKLINLIIHDVGHGVGFWKEAENSEIYGCLIYNCGTLNQPGTYITHGHGIYSQNDFGTKKIRNNYIFNQYGFGIHLYPNPGQVKGYLLEGNCIFNNGLLTNDTFRLNNILANTYPPYGLEQLNVRYNMTYDNAPKFTYNSLYQADVFLGATNVEGKNVRVENNLFLSNNRPGLLLINWDSSIVRMNNLFHKNGIVGASVGASSSNSAYDWDYNSYFIDSNEQVFSFESSANLDFNSWQNLTGFDANSSVSIGNQGSQLSVLQPNEYEPGRSMLIVYNWDTLPEIQVDLSGTGLIDGQSFSILDAQNVYSTAYYSGVFSSSNPSVQLPLTNLTAEQALGNGVFVSHTAPVFYSFLVIPSYLLSIEENSGKDFSIYPNPTKDEITIELNEIISYPLQLKVFTHTGKLILQKTENSRKFKLDVSSLSEGIYFLKLENGSFSSSKKIVVFK